jgi:hypothetical protein
MHNRTFNGVTALTKGAARGRGIVDSEDPGAGLAMAKDLVQMMGGSVQVVTKAGATGAYPERR